MSAAPAESWRVILFTDATFVVPAWAQLLPALGHRLAAVVTSAKRNPNYAEVAAAVGPGVEILVSDRPRLWAAMLGPLRPDLIVATSFPWRLPADVLDLPRLGAVNLHPAPLPRYRGTDTLAWQLRHGERQGAMTLHRMARNYDTGAILGQVPVAIDDDDDETVLLGKLAAATPAMVMAAFPRIAAGDPGDPQDEARATYFGRIPDEVAWKAIDWGQTAHDVHNVVRSSRFYRDLPPGAVGDLDGVPHRITKTQLLPDSKGDSLFGSVVSRDGEMLLVQCGDGLLGVVEYERIAAS